MDTKLDSRQGQFPATFPDTFKDFFAMMSEDEDHLDLFSNLLEDKVIPRATKFPQRRCGGSLRCTTHPNSAAGGVSSGGSGNYNVGRSNSFRTHRPRGTFGGSSTTSLNNVYHAGSGTGNTGSGSLFCNQIKYCCVQQEQEQPQPSHVMSSKQQLFQPTQQQTLSYSKQFGQQNYRERDCTDRTGSVRLGPDGEEGALDGVARRQSDASGKRTNHHPPQGQVQQQQQRRPSILLENSFDFVPLAPVIPPTWIPPLPSPSSHLPAHSPDPSFYLTALRQHHPFSHRCHSLVSPSLNSCTPSSRSYPSCPTSAPSSCQDASCEESDTVSTASSTPNFKIPYNSLKPILKQPQHKQEQQPVSTATQKDYPHRMLPQLPKGGGKGAFHTKETAVHRIQQQSGLFAGSKTNLAALSEAKTPTASAASSSSSSRGETVEQQHYAGAKDGGSYMETQSAHTQLGSANKFNDYLAGSVTGALPAMNNTPAGRSSICKNARAPKSPILSRRRSSSIVASLLNADGRTGMATTSAEDAKNARSITGNVLQHNTRERVCLPKSPLSNKASRAPSIPVECGVLTFQQAMSGAVSPQYSSTIPLLHSEMGFDEDSRDLMSSSSALASVLEDGARCGPHVMDSPTADMLSNRKFIGGEGAERRGATSGISNICAGSDFLNNSSISFAQFGSREKQRMRTSSMPAESRKPRLADTRRAAIHCADLDLDYYRLRSFSITSHGVCNLGDSLRSRRSRSINSVTSTGTSNSGKDRHNSTASRTSGDIIFEQAEKRDASKAQIPAYKIALLGAAGVGKTTLTYQFTTSDYICAYDLSLDDDYGQKTVSVLVDGIETDLEIIDHPACEMSAEAFCSTYNIDLFVVVYSVVDRSSLKTAEKVLQYLKENEMLLTRGAILVGNKTDLERHREVNRQMGRKVAKEIACKFIETSSGLDHNVDELLVGIVAQVKLNPQRVRNLSERDRQRLNLQTTIQKHRHLHMPKRRIVRQMSICQGNDNDAAEIALDESHSNNVTSSTADEGIGTGSERTTTTTLSSSTGKSVTKGPVRKPNKRTLNLESILKMGESELEDEDELHRHPFQTRPISKFELLTSCRTPFSSMNSSPKSRVSGELSSGGAGTVRSTSAGPAPTRDSQPEEHLLEDGNRKTVSKLTNRTKIFLSSVLKFKKAINVKRRNSSSCSDLFVI